MNLCTACDLDFSSVRAFDAHRVGVHAYTYAEGLRMRPPRENGRRCLTVAELETTLDKAGDLLFGLDARGRWGLVKHRESVRKAFLRVPDNAEAVSDVDA